MQGSFPKKRTVGTLSSVSRRRRVGFFDFRSQIGEFWCKLAAVWLKTLNAVLVRGRPKCQTLAIFMLSYGEVRHHSPYVKRFCQLLQTKRLLMS